MMSTLGVCMRTLNVMHVIPIYKLQWVVPYASDGSTMGVPTWYTVRTSGKLIMGHLGLRSFGGWAMRCWVRYGKGKMVFYPLEG